MPTRIAKTSEEQALLGVTRDMLYDLMARCPRVVLTSCGDLRGPYAILAAIRQDRAGTWSTPEEREIAAMLVPDGICTTFDATDWCLLSERCREHYNELHGILPAS